MSKSSVKGQIIRLKNSKERVVETDDVCEELRAKFQSLFVLGELLPTTLRRQGLEKDHRKC